MFQYQGFERQLCECVCQVLSRLDKTKECAFCTVEGPACGVGNISAPAAGGIVDWWSALSLLVNKA